MLIPVLLTLLALAGVAAGVYLGEARFKPSLLAAGGGGLLVGIALFWLLPEIAETSWWVGALGMTAVAAVLLTIVDRLLTQAGRPRRRKQRVIFPLLAAAAIHSFLDGWSVRTTSDQPLANIAVPLGLALHKIPEGIGLGWITRKSVTSNWEAIAVCGLVELATLLGAFVEPIADASGVAKFGVWWMAAVLAVIAGSFLFVGLQALISARRTTGAAPAFLGTLLGVAIAAYYQRRML